MPPFLEDDWIPGVEQSCPRVRVRAGACSRKFWSRTYTQFLPQPGQSRPNCKSSLKRAVVIVNGARSLRGVPQFQTEPVALPLLWARPQKLRWSFGECAFLEIKRSSICPSTQTLKLGSIGGASPSSTMFLSSLSSFLSLCLSFLCARFIFQVPSEKSGHRGAKRTNVLPCPDAASKCCFVRQRSFFPIGCGAQNKADPSDDHNSFRALDAESTSFFRLFAQSVWHSSKHANQEKAQGTSCSFACLYTLVAKGARSGVVCSLLFGRKHFRGKWMDNERRGEIKTVRVGALFKGQALQV